MVVLRLETSADRFAAWLERWVRRCGYEWRSEDGKRVWGIFTTQTLPDRERLGIRMVAAYRKDTGDVAVAYAPFDGGTVYLTPLANERVLVELPASS